ncbi:venom allergen 3-like [Homalodisca vitripennis]|uniref:venom allergen 3-like n=1 Tax=Homalodisca vitripennis TaxID=197043 RepID=UPI001EECAF9E|nr:venom allergen 3-like [Homalodisca vitripennis]
MTEDKFDCDGCIMAFTKFQVIIALCGVLNETRGFNYCKVNGCKPREHTMCKYPANKPDCRVLRVGLDDDQREAILETHNKLRQKVAQGREEDQPAAANMMKLSWNYEAENIAQRWTERCPTDGHDSCRRMKDGTPVGQNVRILSRFFVGPNRTVVVADIVKQWYDEVDYMDSRSVYDFTSVYGLRNMIVGDYTAIVNSDTKQVGCGYVEKDYFRFDKLGSILTCNYVPSGNVKHRPIYKVGAACSACPNGSKCSVRYPGLCTDEEDEYNDVPKHRDKHKPRLAQAISIHPCLSTFAVLFVHVYFYENGLS